MQGGGVLCRGLLSKQRGYSQPVEVLAIQGYVRGRVAIWRKSWTLGRHVKVKDMMELMEFMQDDTG